MSAEPSGEYYDYTTTMKPERPWLLPYHQSFVYKVMNCIKDADGSMKEVFLTFEQSLEMIKRLHHLTCGIPQVLYLTGWQFEGHDSKYPSWDEVNRHLKRPQDAEAIDSLRWLMRTARDEYNASVSLHVNMFDAYPESPLWDLYVEKDVIAKDKDGKIIPGKEWSGMTSYQMSYTQEWKTGLAQKRIDGLIEMLPELADSKTIHIDAFIGNRPKAHDDPISPYLGYTKDEESATQRKIYRYWRDRGVDVTSEWAFGMRPDRFVGLQPWAWHQRDKLEDLPDSLYCGSAWHVEFRSVPDDLPDMLEHFALELLPWYYENNETSPRGAQQMIDGTDICMPALWCEDSTIIAFSKEGYDSKTWELPPDWKNISSVSTSRITLQGHEAVGSVDVVDGRISLQVGGGEALKICPQ